MNTLELLNRIVGPALETDRLGVPVAARVTDCCVGEHDELEPRMAALLDRAVGWLGQDPARLVTQGRIDQGQLTTLVSLTGGASLLVSVGVQRQGSPTLELVLFGTRGILSLEPGESAAFHSCDIAADRLPPRAVNFCSRVRQSLATRLPVSWDGANVPLLASSTPSPQIAASRVGEECAPLQPPFGVLLVAGDHTHQPGYAEAFAADPRCRLIGLTDEEGVTADRQAWNARLARRLDVPLLPDLAAALSRDDVHIVSICAEPVRRGRIIVQAARAGKHLYLDKPLCATREDVDAIRTAVRKAHAATQMFSMVHRESAQRVRQLVRSGVLGDLSAVHCDLTFAKGHTGTADLSRPRRETSAPQRYEALDSKRELTNVGVYGVAFLLWLLGRRVERVTATTGNYFFREHQDNDMEDFGQLLLQLEGNVTATVTAGRTGWRSHPGSGLHRTCLIGTRQSVVMDASRPRGELWADAPAWSPPPRDPEDPMGMWAPLPDSPFQAQPKQSWVTPSASSWSTDVEPFLDCVEHGRPSAVPLEVAAAATDVLLAAYQSAASGRVVEFARGE